MSNLNQYGFTNTYGRYSYTILYMPTDEQIGNSYVFEITFNMDNPEMLCIITLIVIAVHLEKGMYDQDTEPINIFKIISSSEKFEPNGNKYIYFEAGWKVI